MVGCGQPTLGQELVLSFLLRAEVEVCLVWSCQLPTLTLQGTVVKVLPGAPAACMETVSDSSSATSDPFSC